MLVLLGKRGIGAAGLVVELIVTTRKDKERYGCENTRMVKRRKKRSQTLRDHKVSLWSQKRRTCSSTSRKHTSLRMSVLKSVPKREPLSAERAVLRATAGCDAVKAAAGAARARARIAVDRNIMMLREVV